MKFYTLIKLNIVVLLFIEIIPLYAYKVSFEKVWSKVPITFFIESSGSVSIHDKDGGVKASISAIIANSAWNGVIPNLVNLETSNETGKVGDQNPSINFSDPLNLCGLGCISVTITTYGESEIIDSDTFLNPSLDYTSSFETNGCIKEYYIEAILVHEVGHALGLGHVNKSWAAMYPSIEFCSISKSTLSLDDKKGIQTLY